MMNEPEPSHPMKKPAKANIEVQGTEIAVLTTETGDFISLTDMLKAKDGDFFISDCLRNRNTVEFLGIWESVHNPRFNHGEFAIIKSQVGLNSYKLSVKEWAEKMNDECRMVNDEGSKSGQLFSPNGAQYLSPGHRPGSRSHMIFSPEGAAQRARKDGGDE
jgi:hypothetical protein